MALGIDKLQLEIIINGDSSRQELAKLDAQTKELSKALRKLPEDSDAFTAKKAELSAVRQRYDEITESIGLTGMSLSELRKKQSELSAVKNVIPDNHPEALRLEKDLADISNRMDEIRSRAKAAKTDLAAMKAEVTYSLGIVPVKDLSFNQLTGYKTKLETVFKDLAPTDAIFEKTKLEIIAVEKELKNLNNVSLANIHAEIEKSIGNIDISKMSLIGLGEYKHKLNTVFENLSPDHALFGKVQTELHGVNTQMNVLEAGAKGVKAESQSLFGHLADGFNKFQGIALGAIALFTGVAMSMKAMIDGAAKMSDEMTDIQQQTGMTGKQVELLGEKFKYLNTRSSRSELNAIATEAGSLGVAKNQVAEFTESMNMLSTVMKPQFGGNVGDLADKFGVLRNVFTDIKTDNVGTDILHIGNAMDVLAKSGVATSPVMADFANRIAGVGINLGLTTPQVLGISAALQELGVNPERGGTAVVKILQKMTTETDKFAQVAGLSVQDFTKMVNTDLFGAFQLVIQKSKEGGTSATLMANMIKELEVSGAGASEVFSKLGANTSLLTEKVRTASGAIKETSSITESYNLRNNNLAGNLEKVGKWLSSIFVNSTIMRGMEWFVNAWAEWIKKDPTEMLQKEQREVNILAETLKDSTVPMKERNRIYNELKDISPDIVKGIDIQNVSQKKLNENLAEYNKLMINKIYLAGQEKELTDLQRIAAEKKAAYMKAESAVMNEKVVYEERMERIRKGPSFTRMNNDDYYTDREADKKAVAEYDRWKKLLDDKKISMDSYLLHIKNISISASEAMGHGSKRSEKDIAEGRIDMVTLENNLGLSLNNGLHFGDKNSAEKLLDLKIKRQQSEEADRIAEERLNKLSKQKTDLGLSDATSTGGDKGGGKGNGKTTTGLPAGENNDQKYEDFLNALKKKNLDDRARALKEIEIEEKKNEDELAKLAKVVKVGKKGKTKGGISDEDEKEAAAKKTINELAAKERLEVNQKYDLLEEEQAYKLKTAQLMLQDATNKELLKNQLAFETRKMLIMKDSGINTIDQKTKLAEQEIKIQKLMEQIDDPTDLEKLDKKHEANIKAAKADIDDEKERTRKLMEIDIEYYTEKLKLIEAYSISNDSEGGTEITPEEQARIEEAMRYLIELRKKLAKLGKSGKNTEHNFFGFKFTIDDEKFDNMKSTFNTIQSMTVDFLNSMQDARIADLEKKQQYTDNMISLDQDQSKSLEGQIAQAKEQMRKGEANSLGSLQAQKAMKDKEIADLKKQKADEAAEIRKAQKIKQDIAMVEMAENKVVQISNLYTAMTKIFEAHAAIPWVGVAIATALTAGMMIYASQAKSQMTASAYAEGTESVKGDGFPDGVDTVHARLTKKERVMTVDQNKELNGISNPDVVKYVKAGKLALTRPLPLSQQLVQYHIHMDNKDQVRELKAMNSHLSTLVDAQLNREEYHPLANGQLLHIVYVNGQAVQKTFYGEGK